MKNSCKTNNLLRGATLMLAAALIFIAYHASAANDKVTICHMPGGNVENRHEIRIPQSAVNAHLQHGDHVGVCNFGPPEVPEEHLTGPIL
jgi:D-aminopeptidase